MVYLFHNIDKTQYEYKIKFKLIYTMLKLVSMTEPRLEKGGQEREDGKKNRLFYTAVFADSRNPFIPTRKRNFFQDYTDWDKGDETVWKAGDPAIVSTFLGKPIPGTIKCYDVKDYTIPGSDRVLSTYTTVVLEGESAESVLRQNSKELIVGEDQQQSEMEAAIPEGAESLN